MRAWNLLVASIIVLGTSDANAYPRVQRRGDFGAFMTQLATAARRHDMRTLRRLVDRDFTIGEELGRSSSLATVDHEPDLRRALAALADHGACYRTNTNLVQCELPDTGPELDHTRLKQTSFAIFGRGRHGWKMNALGASYTPR